MSTIGRKAMKKMLKRLRNKTRKDMDSCMDTVKTFMLQLDKMTETDRKILDVLWRATYKATSTAMDYIVALEDYGRELDEEWDSYLEKIRKMEKAVKEMSPKKKEGKKKPSYRV